MIPIVYFRSSSINTWEGCQQLYFLTYVLGLDQPTGQKAEQGTIVHKVMECLANLKLEHQKTGNRIVSIEDSSLGKITVDTSEWLKPYKISKKEHEEIKKSQKSESIYITKSYPEVGQIRYGVDVIQDILEKSYNFYSERSEHKWTPAKKRDCVNWTWGFLDYGFEGICDPRRQKIFAAEPFFDLEVQEDWASVGNGQFLSTKGTIDLITEKEVDGFKILNVVDYKTGSRVEWNKKGIPKKTYKKLQQDTQLMLYYHAIKSLYPEYEDVIINIVYVRDGGLFSFFFNDENVRIVKDRIKSSFEEIKTCEVPKMFDPTNMDVRCKNICHFGKTNWPGTNKTKCKHIHDEIVKKGIDKVIEEYTVDGHDIGHYQNPGE